MKMRLFCLIMIACLAFPAAAFAEGNETSLGTEAGVAARELKDTAGTTYAAASAKVAETSKKVEAEAQDAFKVLREQWEALSKQLQISAQQLSQQLQQQWDDFNKSFNKPKQ